MKVYRDLYDQVTSFENLWLAERKAASVGEEVDAMAETVNTGGGAHVGR